MFTSLWCTLEGLPDKKFGLTAKAQNTRGKIAGWNNFRSEAVLKDNYCPSLFIITLIFALRCVTFEIPSYKSFLSYRTLELCREIMY
jgi:hypothetical protein